MNPGPSEMTGQAKSKVQPWPMTRYCESGLYVRSLDTSAGNGERVRVGLTVGKNVKLEKNHVPCCQADHWVWNVGVDAGILGGTVPWAWGPRLPLPPWAGHRWTWESSEEES